MRTVTFSDKKVAEVVNANFVACWQNRAPGFHDENDATERKIYLESYEAYTTGNICTFFLTPDSTALFYAAGYYSPPIFQSVLKTVLRIRTTAFDEEMKLRSVEAYRSAHLESACYGQPDDVEAPVYRNERHVHDGGCGQANRRAAKYLREVHHEFWRTEKPPELDDVRYRYGCGSPFSEEPEGGQPVKTWVIVGRMS